MIISLFSLCRTLVVGQNLVTDPNWTPQALVEDVLVKGACLSIDNVRAIGNRQSIGYYRFQGSAPIFKEGILLSTGYINDAAGPNLSTNISGRLGGYTTDPDLDQLATDSLFDVSGLEFDFVPIDSFVEFMFIFASEEYCEFVGSEFNDVFGFFVSGPGLNGPFSNNAVNVALIPGTQDYVAINSVNHLKNASYYVPNETAGDAERCQKLYEQEFKDEIEYDGMTSPLRARFRVTPCETYHIRLVVGDVADDVLDSGVFLAAKSFNLGGEVAISTVVEARDSQMVHEGCENAYFVFERIDKVKNNNDLTFKLITSELSTAIAGIDYLALPDSLTIPAFVDSLWLPVESFLDAESEPPETIYLELELDCECSTIQGELTLLDTPLLSITPVKDEACLGTPTNIFVAAGGGVPPYAYHWNTIEDTDTISVVIDSITSFRVTVTDACVQRDTAEVPLTPVPPPSGILAGDISICDVREEYTLPIELFGSGPWDLLLRINGRDTLIRNIDQSSHSLPVGEVGTYRLLSVTNNICTAPGEGSSQVDKVPLELQILDCSETDSKRFEFSFSGTGTPVFSIDGGSNFQSLETLTSLEVNKTHRILLMDESGCTDWQTVFLPTAVGYQINIPPITVKLNQQATLSPVLNFPEEFIREVNWSPANDLSCTDCLRPVVTGNESRQYRLDIEDQFGCIHTGIGQLTVDIRPFFIPNAFSPYNFDGNNDRLEIFVDQQTVQKVISFEIFDRWGNQVFGKYEFLPNDTETSWNGYSRGTRMGPGVYVYKVSILLSDGREKIYAGDVTLVN
ncbi:MAG: choice-of-anchor L domain-containing protein [Saprospiraceae bacterium]